MMRMSASWAAWMASITLPELPEVEMARRTSPAGLGPYLLGEHLVEGIVVGDGGEDGAIHRQGDGGQFPPFGFEAADQFGGEVLGVGGRAAVAAGQDLAAIDQRPGHDLDGGGDGAASISTALSLVWALSSKFLATRAIRSMESRLGQKSCSDSNIAARWRL